MKEISELEYKGLQESDLLQPNSLFNHPDDPEKIAELIGYRFENEALLAQALTRKSAIHHKIQGHSAQHFERLEWYGDKVLDLVVTSLLYSYHKNKSEGELTQLRSKFTQNNGPLPRVARHLGLDKFIIRAPNDRLTDKKLADHMEALLGAIFLDCKENYAIAKRFIEDQWVLLGLNQDNLSVSDFGNESLIEAPDVPAKRQEQLNRALLKAAASGDQNTVDLVLSQGANIEAKDETGDTALMLAYTNSYYKLMFYLHEEHRANLDAVNAEGFALIHQAAYHNAGEVLEFLLDNFADVNLKDNHHNTSAHWAAEKGYLHIIEMLHKQGADLTLENKNQETVRQVASRQKHTKIVTYLDTIHADQNRLNNKLLTLVESAKGDFDLHHQTEAIIALANAGANPFSKNKKNETVFQIIEKKSTAFGPSALLMYGLLKRGLPRENTDFTSLKLTGIRNIEQIDFTSLLLSKANFSGNHLFNVNFYQANLSQANFFHCHFINVDFTAANIAKANFTGVWMDRSTLESFIRAFLACKGDVNYKINLNKVDLSDISLDMFQLKKLNFNYSKFNKTTLLSLLPQLKQGGVLKEPVDLRGLYLAKIDLTHISFNNMLIDRVTLESLLVQLRSKAIQLNGARIIGTEGELTATRMPNARLDGLDLSNLDFSGLNLAGASLYETNLTNTCLVKANVRGCDFSTATIVGVDFEAATLDKTALQSILNQKKRDTSTRILLRHITITDASYMNLSCLDLTDSNFVYGNSSSSQIIEFVNFSGSVLKNVNFSRMKFKQVNFFHADLQNTNLSGVTFNDVYCEGANFNGAKLSAESLSYLLPLAKAKKIILKKIDVSGAKLTGVGRISDKIQYELDFTGLDIEEINLQGTKLSKQAFLSLLPLVKAKKISLQGAIIQNMSLSNLDLSNTNLSGITAVNVDFTLADFSGAILQQGKFDQVIFTQAKLIGADFTGSYFNNAVFNKVTLDNIVLSSTHLDRDTLDNLLSYVRAKQISLANIFLENSKKLFRAYHPSTYEGIDLYTLSLKGCRFDKLELSGLQFQDNTQIDKRFLLSILPQLKQQQLTLKGIDLDFNVAKIDFTGMSFAGVSVNLTAFKSLMPQIQAGKFDISGMRFSYGTNLKGVDLTPFNLSGVIFQGVKLTRDHIISLQPYLKNNLISLAGADLQHADLSNLDLSHLNFEMANLRDVNFSGANLQNCNLKKASIDGANFSKSNLSGANLTETIMYSNDHPAIFEQANLKKADVLEINWRHIKNLTAEQISLTINTDKIAFLGESASLKDKALALQLSRTQKHFSAKKKDYSHQYSSGQAFFAPATQSQSNEDEKIMEKESTPTHHNFRQ